jgi:hypothetical protein
MKTISISTICLCLLFVLIHASATWGAAKNAVLQFDGVDDKLQSRHAANAPRIFNFQQTSPFLYDLGIKPEKSGSEQENISVTPQQTGKGYSFAPAKDYCKTMHLPEDLPAGNRIVVCSSTAEPEGGYTLSMEIILPNPMGPSGSIDLQNMLQSQPGYEDAAEIILLNPDKKSLSFQVKCSKAVLPSDAELAIVTAWDPHWGKMLKWRIHTDGGGTILLLDEL